MSNRNDIRSKNNDDDDEEGPGQNRVLMQVQAPFKTYEAVRTQRITTFYLSKIIGDPDQYTDMIHKIRVAAPSDIVYIHLNTGGGRLDTGIQLINAMKDSAARIIAVLDSKAYSLGTLIFLAADEFIVHDNCMFMIHNYSSVTGGKGNEQKSELLATEAWFKKLAKKYYFPFLSHDEIDKVLNGHDIWMDSDEIKKRLKNMVKLQEEAMADADAPKVPRRRRADKTPAVISLETGVLPEPTTIQTTAGIASPPATPPTVVAIVPAKAK
jgi:ATP-dependent protease ClpP protease subunit